MGDARGSGPVRRPAARPPADRGRTEVVAESLVATNLHVIGEARPITVELADGSSHEATAVHATDRDGDLAIVRIAAPGLVPLPLAAAGALVDGQEVVAVGNPHGLNRSIVAKTSCFVNDALIFTAAAPALAGRRVGLAKFRDTEAEFRGFAVGRDLPRAAPPADVMARIEAATAALSRDDGRVDDKNQRDAKDHPLDHWKQRVDPAFGPA